MTSQDFGSAFQNGGYQRTVRFLQRCGSDQDQANEIAQAAWVKGLEHLGQLRDEQRAIEWVNAIARNMRLTSFRRALTVDFSEMKRDPALAPSVNLTAIDLRRALGKCKPHRRQLLEASLDGHSNYELAKQTGKSVDAIHAGLSRARQELKEHMHVTQRQAPPCTGVSSMKVQ